MHRRALVALLLFPVGVATAAGSQPLLLFATGDAGRGADVVVQHLDGTGRVSLTGGAGLASDPAWSPDGQQVAFKTNRDTNGTGPTEIYVVNVDGTGLRAVTQNAAASHFRFAPSWSPDSSQIAYLESNGGTSESADLWVVAAAGGTPRRLTTDGAAKRGVAWQPGGSLLLYDAADPNAGAWGLWTVDASTGARRRIADTRPFSNGEAGYWSPDGSRIAFPDGVGRLEAAAPDGTNARVLAAGSIAGPPSWSPDGRSVAYAATRVLPGQYSRFGPPTNTDVFVADPATGRSQRLTGWFDPDVFGPLNDTPSWWPGGDRLFFHTFRGGANNRVVWEMNADGTCEQPVPALGTPAVGPFWQPGTPAVGTVDCVDLRLRATVDRPQVALGNRAAVTFTLENDGNERATHITIAGAATKGDLTLVSTTVDVLLPGQAITLDGTLGSKNAGMLSATVTATAAEPDATPEDATARFGTTVLPCTIVGTYGPDILQGTPGNDRICGLPGADRIDGGKANDYIDAGNGSDTIIGGPGNDTIIARGGADVVYARDGRRDWIDCGTEYDIAVVDRIDHVSHCEKVQRAR
jgi:Tol biopolymer transport system component